MRIRQVDNPGPVVRAEGDCVDLPYNTVLVSSAGVNIHFWVGDDPMGPDTTQVHSALRKARGARDIVSCTWSTGQPGGYWAHHDIV